MVRSTSGTKRVCGTCRLGMSGYWKGEDYGARRDALALAGSWSLSAGRVRRRHRQLCAGVHSRGYCGDRFGPRERWGARLLRCQHEQCVWSGHDRSVPDQPERLRHHFDDRIAIYSGDGILRCDLSTPAVVGPHQTYPLFALHASLPCLPTPVPQPGLEALQNVVVYWSIKRHRPRGRASGENPLDGYTVSNASTPSALPAGRSTRDSKPIKVRQRWAVELRDLSALAYAGPFHV